jgi:IMP dehydrogenase
MSEFPLTMSFDDVLLVPRRSDITSRREVNLSSSILDRTFTLPVISSPMDTVTGLDMSISMNNHGGFGIIHRYNSIREQSDIVEMAIKSGAKSIAAAVGVTADYESRASALVAAGAFLLCIDVAHGHHTNVERAIKTLRDRFGNKVSIMAGNVATAQGFADLEDWGADAIRVGVGGGSICSTRLQTGHGIPTFHSVLVASRARKTAKLVADGGIRTAGDVVKSLAAGADFVMLGSMLSGTDETPGGVFSNASGNKYKIYRGMASVEAQVAWRGKANSLEGVSTTVPHKGSVVEVLQSLEQNMRSGLSYSGARNLAELSEAPSFIRQTAAGMNESAPHISRK